MKTLPEPPSNVRLKFRDGSVVPVECRYDGYKDGCHIWVVTAQADPARLTMLQCDRLPAHTSIELKLS
jgi:hypothetical protein